MTAVLTAAVLLAVVVVAFALAVAAGVFLPPWLDRRARERQVRADVAALLREAREALR